MPHTRAELSYFNDVRMTREALERIAKVLDDTLPVLAEVLGSTEPRAVTLTGATWGLGTPQPAFPRENVPYDELVTNEPFDDDWTTDDQGERGPEFVVWDKSGDSISSEIVGSFLTESEALACMVALDYLDRAGVKRQRYTIDYPVGRTATGKAT